MGLVHTCEADISMGQTQISLASLCADMIDDSAAAAAEGRHTACWTATGAGTAAAHKGLLQPPAQTLCLLPRALPAALPVAAAAMPAIVQRKFFHCTRLFCIIPSMIETLPVAAPWRQQHLRAQF